MRFGKQRYIVDWGHLLVIVTIAVICAAYLYDTLDASTRINNILFVLPASIIALLLCIVILPQLFKRTAEPDEQSPEAVTTDEDKPKETWSELGWIALLVVAFGIYVFSVERIGFDVASWLFITIGLFVCGERRMLALVLYPPVAAALIVYGFKVLIPYPMFTLIL